MRPTPLILTASTLAACLLAQAPPMQPIPLTPQREIRLAIPAELGAGSALRCLTFDPDADLLHDVAMLWSNGDVVFSYAPEILAAFVRLPVTGATAIARVPNAVPQPVGAFGDRLLVATSSGLQMLSFDHSQLGSVASPSGFVATPVTAPASWQSVLRLDTYWDGGNCWLLAIDSGLQSVRFGKLVGGQVLHMGSATTTSPVRQLLAVDYDGTGVPTFVARTSAGLQSFDATGAAVSPTLLADTVGPFGGLAVVRQLGQVRLAWLAQIGQNWRLRTCRHGAVLHTFDIPELGPVPARFRPTGIAALATESGDDAVLVGQNSTESQLVLAWDSVTGQYASAYTFAVDGVTPNVDNCPPLVAELTNDGRPDFATVLTSQRRLHISTGLRIGLGPQVAGEPGPGEEPPVEEGMDLLPEACELTSTTFANDTMNFHAVIPGGVWPAGLHVQVVAWSQTVLDPSNSTGNGFQPQVLDDLVRNHLYPVTVDLEGLQPRLVMQLSDPQSGDWSPTRHYYFMLRLVTKVGNSYGWASPAQFVGFIAARTSTELSNSTGYFESISQGSGDTVPVTASENRNVGVMLKPDRISPPTGVLKPPAPGAASVQPTPQNW